MTKKPKTTLHLVLTHDWYDMLDRKFVEYREITPKWTKEIWDHRGTLKGGTVVFHRGYTSTVTDRMIYEIDKGPCPIEGWDKPEYYRIRYSPF